MAAYAARAPPRSWHASRHRARADRLRQCRDTAGADPFQHPLVAGRRRLPTGPGATPSGSGFAPVDPAHAVASPPPLRGRQRSPDLLVYSADPLPADAVARLARLPGVTAVARLSLAQVAIENRVITVAAVDPASYRRFAPSATAEAQRVWERVAGGELAIDPALGRQLVDPAGFLKLGNDVDAPSLHIGVLAGQVPQIDAVVNRAWGETLGMHAGNAVLVSTGETAPRRVRPAVQQVAGPQASVQIRAPDPDTSVVQTAYLTGGSVAATVGSFTYRILDHGRIAPDQAWVRANIRTERVPILGAVTCHRVLFPQLRAALTEVVQAGLADRIHPDQYAGCYYPRFIAGTHQLSLHAFGIALDLNVPENQRGTVGQMDRTVVRIFERWGFTWGGHWAYTDPMHFEMNALVEPR
ncbi:MAG: M15 family metallopeptidase [Nocardioides sp.]